MRTTLRAHRNRHPRPPRGDSDPIQTSRRRQPAPRPTAPVEYAACAVDLPANEGRALSRATVGMGTEGCRLRVVSAHSPALHRHPDSPAYSLAHQHHDNSSPAHRLLPRCLFSSLGRISRITPLLISDSSIPSACLIPCFRRSPRLSSDSPCIASRPLAAHPPSAASPCPKMFPCSRRSLDSDGPRHSDTKIGLLPFFFWTTYTC